MVKLCQRLAVFLIALSMSSAIRAHFDPDSAQRQFILTRSATTLEVYVRTPLRHLFVDMIPGAGVEYGWLRRIDRDGERREFLVPDAIAGSRSAFSAHLANSLHWYADGQLLVSRVRNWRLLNAPESQRWLGSGSPSIHSVAPLGRTQ